MALKIVSAAVVASLAGVAMAGDLYSNGSNTPSDPGLNTGATTTGGLAAPGGSTWSEVGWDSVTTLTGNSAGAGVGLAGSNRVADDFNVPAGQTWNITQISFYSYQTGATTAASPFTAVNFAIRTGSWTGAAVFGDTTTNRMSSSTWSGMYRSFSHQAQILYGCGGPATNRPIYRLDCNTAGLSLTAGNYWIDWQVAGSASFSGPWSPGLYPLPLGSGLATPGADAQQFNVGTWVPITETGITTGCAAAGQTFGSAMAFIVRGTQAGCRPDLTTTAVPGSPGYGTPNGTLNNDDFFYFLAQFAANNLAVCDMTTTAVPGSPGYGTPNGVLNNDDFFYYLAIFAAGC